MPDSSFQLDNGNEHDDVCRSCGLNPRDHPIHCIRIASPAPPSYRSVALPSTTSGNLEVPPRRWPQIQPPLPALRFDVSSDAERRPRMRIRRSDFSPLSPATTVNDVDFGRTIYTSGCSIPNTPVDDDDYNDSTKKKYLELGTAEVRDTNPKQVSQHEKLARAERGKATQKALSPKPAKCMKRKAWRSDAMRLWRFEMMCWLLGASCMCAIVAVLCVYQDQKLPKHWAMNITLNAYISILSRAASAALMLPISEGIGQLKWSWFQGQSKKMSDFEMFDNASRGPWGSLILLFRTRGRTLAALGAVVTVFTMAMDPFFQQVVRYPQRTVLEAQNSSIAVAFRIEESQYARANQGGQLMTPNTDMSAIIENHFRDISTPPIQVRNGTRAEIPLSCPTSNCAWESYETLGVCSECVDIVDMLEFDCLENTKLDWVQDSTAYIPWQNGTMCGWFFNATGVNTTMMIGYRVESLTNLTSSEILVTKAMPLISNMNRRPSWGGSINFKHVRNPIANFVVVSPYNTTDDESILESIFQHKKPQAHECMLAWCVKTIESSYHESAYTETIKSQFINTTAGPFPFTFIDADTTDPKDTWKMQYLQDITVDPHARDGQGNTSSFGLSNDTAANVVTIFDDYLPSFFTRPNNASKTWMKYKTWMEDPPFWENPTNVWLPPDNITHHVENLATAMTNQMRNWGNTTAWGKSFSEETFIEVRWVWLILPITVLVLTLLFLLGTMRRTYIESDRVGVWKNSAIVTLLYGLPDELQWKLTDLQHYKKPQSRAKELNVRLLPTRKWRMSGYLLSPTTEKPKSRPDWV
ncbi:hypothetical protein PMIN02_004195 [Paraphaeosphaeria minitans]|uniref:Uncharacterized protein n=1 Tax=Paraphaeosphaeria minitans TaxID=565426 RepID=A0A9P6GU30_9PLEO|nr:hypothetical protein PMIN01_01123 [Paraphaeosphaeria minitans]